MVFGSQQHSIFFHEEKNSTLVNVLFSNLHTERILTEHKKDIACSICYVYWTQIIEQPYWTTHMG